MQRVRKTGTRLLSGIGTGILLFLIIAGAASAHFTMILPNKSLNPTADDFMADLGEEKTLWILWGHPYEHILFDCPRPDVFVRGPEGSTKQLPLTEKKIEGKRAWEASFRAVERGDYVIYANVKAEEHQTLDHVKTIIHCDGEVWRGWDAMVGQKLEILPYTRPYGLEEGFVFSGKALHEGKAMVNSTVEIEKYYPEDVAERVVAEAEEKFQPNPSCMYTRVVSTNEDGEFCFTLDEPGIWYIGAYGPEKDGMEQRAVIQVAVGGSFPK